MTTPATDFIDGGQLRPGADNAMSPPMPEPTGPRRFLAFAAVAALAALLVLWLGRNASFYHDECDFLHFRPDLASFAIPHNDHPVVLSGLAYKATVEVFGTGSYLPYLGLVQLAHIAAAAGIVAVLGGRVGLVAGALFLIFGAGGDNLFWAFQITFVGSAGFGVWAIWAARNRRDALAALLATASIFSSLMGVPFLVGVAVVRPSKWIALPIVLLIAWWVAFGLGWERPDDWARTAYSSPMDVSAWLMLPSFVVRATGRTLADLAGFGFVPELMVLALSVLFGSAGVVMVVVRFARGWRPSRLFVASSLAFLVTVSMVGLVRAVGTGFQPRHVYIAALFMLTALGSLRFNRLSRLTIGTMLSFAFIGNMIALTQSAAMWTARASSDLACQP